MSVPLLQVENLGVAVAGGDALLRQVGFKVYRGETFALLGESGSGKSMTALSVMRLLPEGVVFRSGEVRFDGRDLLRVPAFAMHAVRGRRIAMIFQEPMTSLNPVMTVGVQVVEVLRLHRGLSKAAAKGCTLETFEKVGLDNPALVFSSYPHELSGGMQQRVMIAAAIVGEPDLLICDEPTTALDVTIQAQVLDLLKTLQARLQTAMLFISHDLSIVSNVADRIAVMKDGRVVDETDVAGFFTGRRHPYSRHLLEVAPVLNKRGVSPSRSASGESGGGKLLEVEALKVHFPIRSGLLRRVRGHVKAVDGVSLSLGKGRTLALVGESGSGKTSVAKAVLGLAPVTDGAIRFDGVRFEALRGAALRTFRHSAQIVFQDPFSSMNPKMPVGEIIKEGMRAQPERLRKGTGKGAGKDGEAWMTGRTRELLELVGLDPRSMSRYPHEFSGGQRQRICIARALAVEPRLLICDEPTSALDVSVQAQILGLFRRLQDDLGLSYLFITHDIAVVSHVAHEIAVMHRGRIVEAGETGAVLTHPRNDYTRALLSSVPVINAAA